MSPSSKVVHVVLGQGEPLAVLAVVREKLVPMGFRNIDIASGDLMD